MEFRNMVTMCKTAKETDDTAKENRLLDFVGEGEGGMI